MVSSQTVFVKQDQIKISDSAIHALNEFWKDMELFPQKSPMIVCFDWAESRSFRVSKTGGWTELGEGIDLVAYDKTDIPEEFVFQIGDIPVAVRLNEVYFSKSIQKSLSFVPGEISVFELK